MSKKLTAALFILSAVEIFSQSFSNSSLNGKYFFRHVMILGNSAGAVSEMRTAYGAITFSGTGTYTLTGSQIIGPAAPAAFSAIVRAKPTAAAAYN